MCPSPLPALHNPYLHAAGVGTGHAPGRRLAVAGIALAAGVVCATPAAAEGGTGGGQVGEPAPDDPPGIVLDLPGAAVETGAAGLFTTTPPFDAGDLERAVFEIAPPAASPAFEPFAVDGSSALAVLLGELPDGMPVPAEPAETPVTGTVTAAADGDGAQATSGGPPPPFGRLAEYRNRWWTVPGHVAEPLPEDFFTPEVDRKAPDSGLLISATDLDPAVVEELARRPGAPEDRPLARAATADEYLAAVRGNLQEEANSRRRQVVETTDALLAATAPEAAALLREAASALTPTPPVAVTVPEAAGPPRETPTAPAPLPAGEPPGAEGGSPDPAPRPGVEAYLALLRGRQTTACADDTVAMCDGLIDLAEHTGEITPERVTAARADLAAAGELARAAVAVAAERVPGVRNSPDSALEPRERACLLLVCGDGQVADIVASWFAAPTLPARSDGTPSVGQPAPGVLPGPYAPAVSRSAITAVADDAAPPGVLAAFEAGLQDLDRVVAEVAEAGAAGVTPHGAPSAGTAATPARLPNLEERRRLLGELDERRAVYLRLVREQGVASRQAQEAWRDTQQAADALRRAMVQGQDLGTVPKPFLPVPPAPSTTAEMTRAAETTALRAVIEAFLPVERDAVATDPATGGSAALPAAALPAATTDPEVLAALQLLGPDRVRAGNHPFAGSGADLGPAADRPAVVPPDTSGDVAPVAGAGPRAGSGGATADGGTAVAGDTPPAPNPGGVVVRPEPGLTVDEQAELGLVRLPGVGVDQPPAPEPRGPVPAPAPPSPLPGSPLPGSPLPGSPPPGSQPRDRATGGPDSGEPVPGASGPTGFPRRQGEDPTNDVWTFPAAPGDEPVPDPAAQALILPGGTELPLVTGAGTTYRDPAGSEVTVTVLDPGTPLPVGPTPAVPPTDPVAPSAPPLMPSGGWDVPGLFDPAVTVGRELAGNLAEGLAGGGQAVREFARSQPLAARARAGTDGGVRAFFPGGGHADYDRSGHRVSGTDGTPSYLWPGWTPTWEGALDELGRLAPFVPGLGGEERGLGLGLGP